MAFICTLVTTGATPDVAGNAGVGIVHGEDSRTWDVTAVAAAQPDTTTLITGLTWTPDWITITPWGANGGACYTERPYIAAITPAVITAAGVVTSTTTVTLERGVNSAGPAMAFRMTLHRYPDPEV